MADKLIPHLRNILIATDGSEFSSGAEREGIKLAKKSGGKVNVLFVIDFNEELEALAPNYIEKMEESIHAHLVKVKADAEAMGVECHAFSARGSSPFIIIAEQAEKLGADVIVVGRRGRTGLARLMMGSVTKRVVGHAGCKVLVVPKDSKIECNNILVASDGSKFSEAAINEAISIAKFCGSKMTAVTVVGSDEASPMDITRTQMPKDMVAESEMKNAEHVVKSIEEMAKREGLQAEAIIASGRPYEAIVETAKQKRADLIVIGSHGRTGLDRLLMGSVAERVVGNAPCAVLVAKC